MKHQRKARLAGRSAALRWLADPVAAVPDTALPGLYASALAAPKIIVMASVVSIGLTVTAALRTGWTVFWVFLLVELVLLTLRLHNTRRVRQIYRAGRVPAIEPSMRLSIAWCAQQGLTSLAIALSDDMPLLIVTIAFILGLIAPICGRNYAMPRLATLMVMLCDLPFKLGLALAGEPVLWLLLPTTIPLFVGARTLLGNFGWMLARSLETAEHNRRLAGHDPLTGLVNRHGLDETLARLTDTPQRPLVLLCIDLDRFKPVNDRYGHAAGDSVLVQVAARLREVTPDHGFIVRLGGDEFMVAVGGLAIEDAGRFAQRLHHALATPHYILDDNAQVPVGASVGYACFPEDAATFDALRRRADAALYASKRSGRLRRYDVSLTRISDAA